MDEARGRFPADSENKGRTARTRHFPPLAREQRFLVLVGTEPLHGQRVPRSLVHVAGRVEQSRTDQSAVELFAQSRRKMERGTLPGALSRQRARDVDR